MKIHRALLAFLLCACSLRAALAAGLVAPNAGAMLQQLQPAGATGAASAGPRLTVQEKPDTPVPPGMAFRVTRIVITGNTRVATQELHALVQDAEGQDLTLAALSAVVGRITAHYQRKGFALARALVPGQTITDGVLQVQVLEARYDAVLLDNRTPLGDALLRSALAGIQTGDVIEQAPLDEALLSLADIPGVVVSATMQPGSGPGLTDVVVRTTAPGAQVSGTTVIDNHGSEVVGRTRATQSLRLLDPFNQQTGAVLELSGLTSGAGLNYARIAYEAVLNGAARRAGGAYSSLQYTVGGPLAASGARGEAQAGQLWLRHSLLRSYAANLYAQVQYDNTQLRDHPGMETDSNRDTDKLTASLVGDFQDAGGLGAVNHWNLSLSSGTLSYHNAATRLDPADRAEGSFTKLNGAVSRLQQLTPADSVYAALALQWANRNLDASEKLALGGAGTVRALSASALSGDMGVLLNLEYRHTLGAQWGGGNWQGTVFLDCASVQLNQTPVGRSENFVQVRGAGVGLVGSGWHHVSVKAQLATRVGAQPAALAGEADGPRAWVEVAHSW